MGRHPKPTDEKKDSFFQIRMTSTEKQALKGLAGVRGITVADCIRSWMHQDLQRIGSKS